MSNWLEAVSCYSFVLHACHRSEVRYDRVSFGDFELPGSAWEIKETPYVQVHIVDMSDAEQEAFRKALWVNKLVAVFIEEPLKHNVEKFIDSWMFRDSS